MGVYECCKTKTVSLSEVVPEKNRKSNRLASSIMMKSGDGTFVSMTMNIFPLKFCQKSDYLQMHITMIMIMIMMCVVCYIR